MEYGNTALHGAVGNGHLDAKTDIPNNEGSYPLHVATHKKCISSIKILLKHGSGAETNPNVRNHNGMTPKDYIKASGWTNPKGRIVYNKIIELLESYEFSEIKEPE
jgi:ankyrin repeat protein